MKANERNGPQKFAGRGYSLNKEPMPKANQHRVVQRPIAKQPNFNPTKQASSIRYPRNFVNKGTKQAVPIPAVVERPKEEPKTVVEEQKEEVREESDFLNPLEEAMKELMGQMVVHEPIMSSGMAEPQELDIHESNGIFTSHLEIPPQAALEISKMGVDKTIQRTLKVNLDYHGNCFVATSNNKGSLLMALKQLRMYNALCVVSGLSSNDPNDLKNIEFNEALDYKGERKCSICLEDIRVGHIIRRTPCLHLFHVDCIQTWMINKPICPIDKQLLKY